MSHSDDGAALLAAEGLEIGVRTPTGTQATAVLFRRRLLVAMLNVLTFVTLTGAFSHLLATGGWTHLDQLLLVAFALSTPWTILGFWNALIGLWLLHLVRDPVASVSPYAGKAGPDDPIVARVAVLMTIRNEPPARAFARLRQIKTEIDATAASDRFAFFVLSDTTDPAVAAEEEACFAAWRLEAGEAAALHYRRRIENTGYKAGNIRDFIERFGDGFDLMLGLDADSLMGADSILRLVRIMQANPMLGILQSLVVGMPSQSAFARLFQFGMRHGMRSYTMGAAWWAGDCGPYWGHNAVIRIAPFRAHCHLPVLPGRPPLGGHILSHDQVEAVLMRRAGYEVRVLPEEMRSFEENPPHLMEFTRRDLRWCQGNMQYWRLLTMPGLPLMSRFQLAWAILMYLGVCAWIAFIMLAALKVFDVELYDEPFPASLGLGLFIVMFVMSLMPKLAGVIDVLLRPQDRAAYGGAARLLSSAFVEFVFGMLLGPVVAVRVAIFVVGLAFGRTVTWEAQARDAERLGWGAAMRGLWPQLLFATGLAGILALFAPGALLWAAPVLTGLFLAVPFAVFTAEPAVGAKLARWKLCAIPEEIVAEREIGTLTGMTKSA